VADENCAPVLRSSGTPWIIAQNGPCPIALLQPNCDAGKDNYLRQMKGNEPDPNSST